MDIVGDGCFQSVPESEENDKMVPGIPVLNSKNDVMYNLNHKRRGLAVIFDHENFNPNLKLDTPRWGTAKDSISLEGTLKILGFQTIKYKDYTLKTFTDTIDTLAAKDYSDCDCLFIAVLSHGKEGIIYTKDNWYSINMLIDRFTADKCPTLAGKPKIFIIQACQGTKLDPGVEVRTTVLQTDSAGSDTFDSTYRIPIYADFLVAYSSVPGYYSWRHERNGSWFIQSFCKMLEKHWLEYDFLTILILVNGKVAFEFETHCPDEPLLHRQKQIPYITTMFTRILKFTPKQVVHGSIGPTVETICDTNNGS